MIKINKLLLLSAVLCLLFSVTAFGVPYVNIKIKYDGKTETYNKEKVYLYVNSKEIKDLPLEPIIFNNYTLVPARETFENVGAVVTWIKDTEQIQVVYKDKVVLMKINDTKATVDGELFSLDIPPKLINGKTMIPVRFVSEACGFIVDWDNAKRIINIKEKPIEETSTQTTTATTTETTTKAPEKVDINIQDIEMPDSDEKTFFIYADREIKKYEKVVLDDGSLAIDIYNSKNNITKNSIDSVSEFITKVDIENRENNITRFIFRTKGSVLNNNFLLDNGKTLAVNFGGNSIKKISTYMNLKDDCIDIYAEYPLEYTIEKNVTKDKIVLDIKNCPTQEIIINKKLLSYVTDINYNYISQNELLLELSVNQDVEFSKKQDGNVTTIIISKEKKEENNNNTNNTITSGRQFKIPKKSGINIDISKVKHTDDYLNKKYVLEFNSNISELIPNGTYPMDNELVNSIDISNSTVTLNCKKITAVNVTEDDNNIYINMLLPKEKFKNIVVIDPGHGGGAPGTSGSGLIEKNINLAIALKINKLFEDNKDIKVYFTRLTDVNPSFDDRTNMSNEVGDMFISIHQNSSGSSSTSANGTEVFYLNPNTNEAGLTSKDMADIVQKNMLEKLGSNDRKVKTSNLIVLRNNKKPAILCEVGFLSNPAEAQKLASEEYQQKAAQAIYDSIIEITTKFPSVR